MICRNAELSSRCQVFVRSAVGGAPSKGGSGNRPTSNFSTELLKGAKRPMNKIIIVKIADLDMNLFVRKTLNQNHALYLGELVQNGVKLPPILINPQKKVIDGRHRVEAYELNDLLEIEAEVVNITSDAELIAAAFKANVGGALPPNSQDIEHTIVVLLGLGEAQKHIVEMLGLPVEMTRGYIKNVQSRLMRQKLQQAADAVTEGGLTVPKAAEQFRVNPDRLKETLSGNRKKQKKEAMNEVQLHFTKRYRSLGSSNAASLRRLFDKFQDGDVSPQQVVAIFEKLDQLQKQSARSLADWRKRFDCANGSNGESQT